MTETLAFGIVAASLVVAPLAGRAAGRRGGVVSWIAIACGFAGSGIFIVANFLPERVAWALEGNDLALLFPSYGGVPILGGFGALFRRAKPGDRRSLRIFLIVVMAYYGWQATYLLGDPGVVLSNDSGTRGPIRQISEWSCAPAAGASLLGTIGVHSTEAEMARLMRTRPSYGTPTLLAERGLARKLEGTLWRPVMRPIDYDGLVAAGRPGLAAVKLSLLLGHMIAFTRVTPEEIEVLDPAKGGRRTESRAQFEAEWTGQAILVVPRGE